MKNKHLLLLLLVVIATGWLIRQIPLPYRDPGPAEVFSFDTSQIMQLAIQAPGRPEILISRTAKGWMAAEGMTRSLIDPSTVAPLLAALRSVYARNLVKRQHVDTLGFNPGESIEVLVYEGSERYGFHIGKEAYDEQPVTFIRRQGRPSIYVVSGHWRSLFSPTLDHLRALPFPKVEPSTIKAVAIAWRKYSPLHLIHLTDSTSWRSVDGKISAETDSVTAWLNHFKLLEQFPRADFFDESQASDTYLAQVSLEVQNPDDQPIVYKFYQITSLEIPDDISALRKRKANFSAFVFSVSSIPGEFFALEDTALARQLCFGLRKKILYKKNN